MLFITVSPYGYAAIIVLILTIVLTRGVVKRRWPGERAGCMNHFMVASITGMLLLILVMTAMAMTENIYSILTKPRYEAIVVDYHSHRETESYRDANNRSSTREIMMHTPVVQFKGPADTMVVIESDISSSGKPTIGAAMTVVYNSGDKNAQEYSFSSALLMGVSFVVMFIIAVLITGAAKYALGHSMSAYYEFAWAFGLRFLLPFMMLGFLVGMGTALWGYFNGNKDDLPLWAMLLCCFFCVVLFAALVPVYKIATAKKLKLIQRLF